jgi:hypothetical protein
MEKLDCEICRWTKDSEICKSRKVQFNGECFDLNKTLEVIRWLENKYCFIDWLKAEKSLSSLAIIACGTDERSKYVHKLYKDTFEKKLAELIENDKEVNFTMGKFAEYTSIKFMDWYRTHPEYANVVSSSLYELFNQKKSE